MKKQSAKCWEHLKLVAIGQVNKKADYKAKAWQEGIETIHLNRNYKKMFGQTWSFGSYSNSTPDWFYWYIF